MYRRDVDFLRGLAILSVVFFHAGIPWAKNGFIGVDVFFVISGYLITSTTLRDITKNEFKFLRFIERRARRILPGLLTTLALNVPLFLLLFSPKYIENIFKSYLSIMTFVPNFFFWRQSGYFDPKAELQLLLNTWSLGIEEQFYILFAIFAFFYVKKRVKIKILLILSVLVFLISLISSITISQYKGGATFYLLPFRLWEFLAGSLIAILDYETRIKTISTKNQLILKCLGLVILICSLFIPRQNTYWPNWYSIIPIIGTSLIIQNHPNSKITSLIFENRIIGYVGRVSFSWFLWHWPIIVYLNYVSDIQISDRALIFSSFIALIMAIVQFEFIEKRFRNLQKVSTVRFWRFSAITGSLLMTLSIWGVQTNGFENNWVNYRFREEHKVFAENVLAQQKVAKNLSIGQKPCQFIVNTSVDIERGRMEKCFLEFGKAMVIIGDSHGVVLSDILFKSMPNNFLISWARPTSRPSKGINGQYADFLSFLNEYNESISKVFFHQSGTYLMKDNQGKVDSEESFRKGSKFRLAERDVRSTIKYLNLVSKNAEVIWLGPYLESRINLDNPLNMKASVQISNNVIERFEVLDGELKLKVSEFGQFRYVSLLDIYRFPSDRVFVDECLVWQDMDHPSSCGRLWLAKNRNHQLQQTLSIDH